MTDLIERLEKAPEGSRELDAEIAIASRSPFAANYRKLPEWALKNFPTWCKTGRVGQVACEHDNGEPGLNWGALPFSTSLDAALTLVPEGWGSKVMVSNNRSCGHAVVSDSWGCEHRTFYANQAATPALALCIAALKAREFSHG